MTPAYALAAHVGVIQGTEPTRHVHLADLRTGPIITLTASAATILLVALEQPAADLVAEVARITGTEEKVVAPHAGRMLRDLSDLGLIEATRI